MAGSLPVRTGRWEAIRVEGGCDAARADAVDVHLEDAPNDSRLGSISTCLLGDSGLGDVAVGSSAYAPARERFALEPPTGTVRGLATRALGDRLLICMTESLTIWRVSSPTQVRQFALPDFQAWGASGIRSSRPEAWAARATDSGECANRTAGLKYGPPLAQPAGG